MKVPLALSKVLIDLGLDDEARKKLEELIANLVHCATYYGVCCERGEAWTRLARFNPKDWGIETEVAGGDLARKLQEIDWEEVLPISEKGTEEKS